MPSISIVLWNGYDGSVPILNYGMYSLILVQLGTLRVGGGPKLCKIDIIQLLMDHRM